MDFSINREQIEHQGFAIIEEVYSNSELEKISHAISKAETCKPTFRKTSQLFAIRQFLKEIPEVQEFIFTPKLNSIISKIFGDNFFVVKSIYFDKPGESNWFVSYHQDLTISVDKKKEIEGFRTWTEKHNQFAVQPPIEILQKNFTIRIHLDDTDENNGALKIFPASHTKGILKFEQVNAMNESEIVCCVRKGGVMIMRPLLFHASDKSKESKQRRVIHIEFSNSFLPYELNWSELLHYKN